MGQAKLRGAREERIAMAIARREQREAAQVKEIPRQRTRPTQATMELLAMLVLGAAPLPHDYLPERRILTKGRKP